MAGALSCLHEAPTSVHFPNAEEKEGILTPTAEENDVDVAPTIEEDEGDFAVIQVSLQIGSDFRNRLAKGYK